jgi:soluble lytic murein transglycosylase-like protein
VALRRSEWLWIGGLAAAAGLALGPGGGLATLTSGPVQQAAILVQAQKWGEIFGIPASWIMAIAKIESGWRPGAKNLTSPGDVKRGGAWGAMQVTLTTAQALAQKLRANANAEVRAAAQAWAGTGGELLSVGLGVLFGTALLAQLNAQFPGDFGLVAAAYNRGAGGVRKMLAAGKDPRLVAYAQKAETAREAIA